MGDQPDNNPWEKYRTRVDNVIEFIHSNLNAPLSSDTLAEVAHLSPYHWHRIYRAITGESAAATVKRSRMHKAAADLIRTSDAISDIGAAVGYPEVHSPSPELSKRTTASLLVFLDHHNHHHQTRPAKKRTLALRRFP